MRVPWKKKGAVESPTVCVLGPVVIFILTSIMVGLPLQERLETPKGTMKRLPPRAPGFTDFEGLRALPSFTTGNHEFVVGSTLTRDARLASLFVDAFFVGVKSLHDGLGLGFRRPSYMNEEWQRGKSTDMVEDVYVKAT